MASDRYKSWRLKTIETEQGTLLDRLLAVRGIQTSDAVEAYLNPSLAQLHDPFLLPDMSKACELLVQAIRAQRKIAIHGDYDVDGLTGTALLVRFLHAQGIDPIVVIPDRFSEGYGLTDATAQQLIDSGCELLVTVDCGISSIEEISRLTEAGIQVVVTDHHECGEYLPAAQAVVNPKRADSQYPFLHLAGVAVAMKLVQACCQQLNQCSAWHQYLDLVCLGTVADVVPLIDENRCLVAAGLDRLNAMQQTPFADDAAESKISSIGLLQLIRAVNPDQKPITARTLGFSVCPKLNAAGRLGDTKDAIRLLLTDRFSEAKQLADRLIELNEERRTIENQITHEAMKVLDDQLNKSDQKILIASDPNWHPGVIGIAAARLSEYYTRPVIVLTREGDQYRGSCRSWGDTNLLTVLQHAAHTIDRFGGHREAAGLTLSIDQLTHFKQAVADYAAQLDDVKVQSVMLADLVVSTEDLTIENAETLILLEPYGQGNPVPLFICRQLTVVDLRTVGQGAHLKLSIQDVQSGLKWDAIAFRQAEASDWIALGDTIDVLFSLELNEWRGRRHVQLNIQDIHPSDAADTGISDIFRAEQLYQSQQDLQELADQVNLSAEDLLPDHYDYRMVYQYLRTHFDEQPRRVDLQILTQKISSSYQKRIHLFQLSRVLNVFEETGLINQQRIDLSLIRLSLVPVREKVNLDQSPTFRYLSKVLESGVF